MIASIKGIEEVMRYGCSIRTASFHMIVDVPLNMTP